MKMIGFAAGLALGLITTPADSKYELKLKDTIDILAEYDLVHVPIVPLELDEHRYWVQLGATDYDDKQIAINKLATLDLKREAVIHELYHAHFDKLGVKKQSEDQIRILSKEKYNDIYGEK